MFSREGSLPWAVSNRVRDETNEEYFSWLQAIKEWENNLISGQTKMGKTLVCQFFVRQKTKSLFRFHCNIGRHYFHL